MGDFKGYIIGIIMVTLFIFLLALFAIEAGNDYGLDVTDLEGEQTGLSQINQTIIDFHTTASGWKDIFVGWKVLNPFTDLYNLYNLFKTMWGVLTLPFDVIIQLFSNVFPIPNWIGDVLGGLFIASILFAVWKVLKTGG